MIKRRDITEIPLRPGRRHCHSHKHGSGNDEVQGKTLSMFMGVLATKARGSEGQFFLLRVRVLGSKIQSKN